VAQSQGVVPTEAGRYVYKNAQEILKNVDSLVAGVEQLMSCVELEVTLGLTPSLIRGIGPQIVLQEREAVPGIRLHLHEAPRAQLVDGLRAGEFDYVFAHDIGTDTEIRSVPLLRQALVLVTRPCSDLKPGPVIFSDAICTDMVVRSETSLALELLNRMATSFGLSPNITYQIDSLAAMKQLILQCNATSVMTADLIAEEVARGELEVHEIVDPPLEAELQFAMRCADAPTDADLPLLEFLDLLLDDFCAEFGTTEDRLGHLVALAGPVSAPAAELAEPT
jgi:LysR family nitrogen assimilation transcriptional regulator